MQIDASEEQTVAAVHNSDPGVEVKDEPVEVLAQVAGWEQEVENLTENLADVAEGDFVKYFVEL